MKNYELIELLGKFPAGATVRFCAVVTDAQIDEQEPDCSVVTADITDMDFDDNKKVISLF
jgi:hypothetical protein